MSGLHPPDKSLTGSVSVNAEVIREGGQRGAVGDLALGGQLGDVGEVVPLDAGGFGPVGRVADVLDVGGEVGREAHAADAADGVVAGHRVDRVGAPAGLLL